MIGTGDDDNNIDGNGATGNEVDDDDGNNYGDDDNDGDGDDTMGCGATVWTTTIGMGDNDKPPAITSVSSCI